METESPVEELVLEEVVPLEVVLPVLAVLFT
jgi:hypothetical protein